jgi:uncharacterized membrane protein
LAATAFVASAVEAVEALTVVLAVGYTQGWRAALAGAGWASLTLAAIVAVFGPAIGTLVPLGALKIAIGLFLVLFGLAWARKAIQRYGGQRALHDEEAIFEREVAALRRAGHDIAAHRLGFATSYNAVLLEGLEVAVIVVTFGAAGRDGVFWASLGALAALALVGLAGIAARKPFSRVPENAMKFVVGIMLTTFGTFWGGEGLGVTWWGGDLALLPIAVAYLAVSALAVALLRRGGALAAMAGGE